MKQVGELANAVGEAWAGPRVIGVTVDDDELAREAQPVCPPCRLLGSEAARSRDHELGPERQHLLPARRVRRLAAAPEDVSPSGGLDHLRKPVPGAERRVEPLGEEHATSRKSSCLLTRLLECAEHSTRDLLAASSHAEP